MMLSRVPAAVLVLLAPVAFVRADKDDGPRHPHLHHALHELKEARVELKEAKHDFGGHREEALKAVDAAIVQLDLALKMGATRSRP